MIVLKLSAIDKSNSVYKMYISEFWYLWSKVRSILWPLQRQWDKIERRLFWTKTILNTLKHRVTGKIDTLNVKIATSEWKWMTWKFLMTLRSLQVMKGHRQFFGNIFYRDNLKWWKHLRCVQDDDTDQLICHMTFSDQMMPLTVT